jgi:hypothetical protein
MAALLPEPNQASYPSNDYFAAGSYSFKRNNYDVKTNYNPTQSTTLFGRYSISKTTIFDPQALGQAGGPAIDAGQPGTAPSTIQSAAIGATHTFTPNLLIDGNIGFLRQHLGAENADIRRSYSRRQRAREPRLHWARSPTWEIKTPRIRSCSKITSSWAA